MRYLLLSMTMLIYASASSQDGKLIEKVRINASADSFLRRTNPFYDSLVHILDQVEVYRLTYLSDGLKVIAYLDQPKKPGKYPCIIKNHGGNRESGKLQKYNYMGDMAEMASWGYCVVGSQYRGVDGGEGKEDFGGKDLDDVLNIIPLFNEIGYADTSRIGMYGVSRGGMVTYLALTKTNLIKAAVIVSGVADFKNAIEAVDWADTMFYNWLPEYRADKEEWTKKRSVVLFADKVCKTTPIFIIHGTADDRVPLPQVLSLAGKFYALKQPFRLALFEGGGHGVAGQFESEVTLETRHFFDDYLRDKKKWPSLEPHK